MEPRGGKPRDYYEILQIHERAIPEVVERVFRVLARKYHPDVHPAEKKKWAEQMMTELNVAYSVISDVRKRAEYDAQRRVAQSTGVSVEDVAEGAGARCFNHPKASSTGFCFWCGRPICDLCRSPHYAHPTCTVCEEYVAQAQHEATEDPAREARSQGGRPMGPLGVIAYCGLIAVMAAAIGATGVALADSIGADARHSYMTFIVLGLVFVLFVIREVSWRVVCPECHRPNGRADFRAASPWSQFFAPTAACTNCGHWFAPEELRNAFR